jgi:hypothetical protein
VRWLDITAAPGLMRRQIEHADPGGDCRRG